MWSPGNVPRRQPGADLVLVDGTAHVSRNGCVVPLDELGRQLWGLLDGARSAPALAQELADHRGESVLPIAVAVHRVLDELAGIEAVGWS